MRGDVSGPDASKITSTLSPVGALKFPSLAISRFGVSVPGLKVRLPDVTSNLLPLRPTHPLKSCMEPFRAGSAVVPPA